VNCGEFGQWHLRPEFSQLIGCYSHPLQDNQCRPIISSLKGHITAQIEVIVRYCGDLKGGHIYGRDLGRH
jgi:hypothetical protein